MEQIKLKPSNQAIELPLANDKQSAWELRCSCGRLIIRSLENGIELACPRCKKRVRMEIKPQSVLVIQPIAASDHASCAPEAKKKGGTASD